MEKNRRENFLPCETIGVAGAGRGVGVTHFCVMAANYLTAVAGDETAVLEWNGSGDFGRMELACTGGVQGRRRFQILGTDYYKGAGAGELALCLDRYRRILIDFGELRDGVRDEFARCGKRVLIGSFSEWQWETFWGWIERGRAAEKGWILAAAFGSGETRREVVRKLKIPVLEIPLSADAFTVTPGTLEFFQTFFMRR